MKEQLQFIVDFTVHITGLWWPYLWPVLVIFTAGFGLWWVASKIKAELDWRAQIRRLKDRRSK
jgi:ABC-type dipeptide/oligopeptide/nickel transport system permease subunit